MLTFSISFVYLFIYIFIYLCIYSFIYLFIYFYILFRYINFNFFLCFLSLDFSLIWSFHLYIMSICVCVNWTIDIDLRMVLDGSSFWADWHHCILYSTHHSSLPEKEHN